MKVNTRSQIIKYRFRWHCRYCKAMYKRFPSMIEHTKRPIQLWRACQLLWKRKSYTNRLYAITPDHINFHKGVNQCIS